MKNTIIKVLSVVMAMVMLMGSVLVISASAADECKHENYEQFGDPVAATCTEWGFTLYQCSDCKKAYKTEFNTFEKPHNLTKGFEWIVKEEVAGTCIADAYCVNACPVCEEEVIVVTPNSKGDHAWGEWVIVDATCTADGNKTRTCATCDKVETVALTEEGHEWVADKANYVEPKCFNYVTAYGLTDAKLANGSMPYTCKNCDATRTVVIEPVNYHTYVEMEAEADTCEVIGHNKGSFCKWCKSGKTADDIVTDVIKHVWTVDNTKEIKYPNCETAGFWTNKCANCNTSYVHTAEATGHDWDKDNPTKEVEPTCTTWGYKLYGCTKCGSKFENESIAPLGHKWAEEGTKYPADCTNAGRIEYACTNEWTKDGETVSCTATNKVEDKNSPALGHGETYDVAEITGDCTTDTITAGKKCVVCDKYVEGGKIVKAPGHKYVNNVCTVAGKYDTVCDVCGDVKAEGVEVATTGKESHALRLVTKDPATCTTPGKAYYDCKYCDKYATELLTQTIPALGHKAKETKVAATCTKDGYVLVTCETCLEQLSYTVLTKDPNGHTFADGTLAVKATCTTPGFEHGICLNCGYTVSKTLPALGHDIEIIAAKAATCTDAGNKQGERCKRENCTYAVVAETIPALGHDDQKDASVIAGYAATCKTKGLTDGKKCLRCEAVTVKQVEIPAYDHYSKNAEGILVQYAELVPVAATCKGDGSIGFVAHECYYCDEAYIDGFEYIPAHVYPDAWTKVEVTCEKDGYEYKECACGAKIVKENSTVKATGHKNAAGTVFNAACSYAEGFDTKCTNKNCDYATKVVPVVHNYAMEPQVIDPCQGYGFNLYICEDCGHQKVDGIVEFAPIHNEEVISAPAAGATPTPDKALATVYKCKDCGNVRTAYTPVGGISTKTEIKNLTNPGADFVEGTKKVQFVISIKGDKVTFHDFIAVFTYDKTALKFKSASITKELSGMTIAGATHSPDAGKVNLNAYVANDEDGKVTNVALTGEWQEFIVLEFEVLSEAFKDKTAGVLTPAANLTSATGGNYASFFFRASYDANGEVSVAGVNLATSNVTNLTTSIYKLGDANKDGVVNTADFAAVQKLILTDGYMAQADIDGDGKVAAKDLSLLQKLIVGSYTVKQLADGRK